MPTYNLSPIAKQQFFDSNGNLATGYLLYTYLAGTTTATNTYTTQSGSANANPIVLDARGEADIWLDPTITYKFVLKTAAGATVWTVDNLSVTDATKNGIQSQSYTAGTTGGTSTAYTLTPSPAITALAENQRFAVEFHTASGSSPTLAVSGLTAKNLKYRDAAGAKTAVASGDIPTDWRSDVIYDGTDWIVLDVPSGVTAVAASRGYLSGFNISNNSGDTNFDLDITAGVCRDSTNTKTLTLSAALTGKRFDAVFAAGSGGGATDVLPATADAGWHVFAILKDSDNSVDILYSLSPTAPTMPSGYTYFRRIGAFRTDVNAFIRNGFYKGDEFIYTTPVHDGNNITIPSANRTLFALSVPTSIEVQAIVQVSYGDLVNTNSCHITYPGSTDQAPSSTTTPAASSRQCDVTGSNGSDAFRAYCRTNTSRQVGLRTIFAAGVTTYSHLVTIGWVDYRGRFD